MEPGIGNTEAKGHKAELQARERNRARKVVEQEVANNKHADKGYAPRHGGKQMRRRRSAASTKKPSPKYIGPSVEKARDGKQMENGRWRLTLQRGATEAGPSSKTRKASGGGPVETENKKG